MDSTRQICEQVLATYPDRVSAYIKGERGIVGFLVSKAVIVHPELDVLKARDIFTSLLLTQKCAGDLPGVGGTVFQLVFPKEFKN